MDSPKPAHGHRGREPRPLLVNKVAAPLLQPGIVTRSRLLARLDESVAKPLSVVVAPAGWGKTSLLAEWAFRAGDHTPVAWLTLDETDDEPNRFWTHVIAALRTTAPEIGDRVLAALRVPGIDPLEVALPTLLTTLPQARHSTC